MIITELMMEIAINDVRLWTDGERLKYSAPRGNMPIKLKEELALHKDEVIVYLQKHRGMRPNNIPPIEPIIPKENIPVSFSQEHIWMLHQLNPNGSFFNLGFFKQFKGNVSIKLFKRVCCELVRRHEALRTNFKSSDGELIQIINPYSEIKLPIIDLSDIPIAKRRQKALDLAHKEIMRPFDLCKDPLFRVGLLHLNDEEYVLTIAAHHIVCDLISFVEIAQDYCILLITFANNKPSSIPEPVLQYSDYAVWERKYLQGDVLQEHRTYWEKELNNIEAVELPRDYPSLRDHAFQTGQGSILIDRQIIDPINKIKRDSGATLFMILLAVLKIVLYKWTGNDDIVVLTTTANRLWPQTQHMVGCFINFFPLRSKISSYVTARMFLESVVTKTRGSFSHQLFPFIEIVKLLKSHQNTNSKAVFNISFVLQNMPTQDSLLNAIDLEGNVGINTVSSLDLNRYARKYMKKRSLDTEDNIEMELPSSNHNEIFQLSSDNLSLSGKSNIVVGSLTPNIDLRLFARQSSDGILLTCEYNKAMFKADTINYFLESYRNILTQFVHDQGTIVKDFKLVDKLCIQSQRARSYTKKLKIIIAATFTAEPIKSPLLFWMDKLLIPSEIEVAPYNQVFQGLLDPSSTLNTNRDGVNVILIRFEDWMFYEGEEEIDSVFKSDEFNQIEQNVKDFIRALRFTEKYSSIPYLVCLCPVSPTLGDAACVEFFKRMEVFIAVEFEKLSFVHVITPSEVKEYYPVPQSCDADADQLANIPYTQEYFAALGTMIARKIRVLKNKSHKVIVLDCDGTLWRGTCGERGPFAIVVDTPRKILQEFMVSQQEAGILICLCSKNNAEDVNSVFTQHKDMPLKQKHLVASRINWQPKSENIRSLSRELALGIESFIFIDDSPFECAEVQAGCPEVLTLQLPAEPESIPQYLKHIWFFDRLKGTDEDKRRTQFYKDNIRREHLRNETITFAEFIENLNLQVSISSVEREQFARISQLTYRTNQFNTTGVKYSESEIQNYYKSENKQCLVVKVSDRFGDYGLVGTVMFAIESDSIIVETFLLSCRVLGRGVEHKMLARLGQIAKAKGLKEVSIRCVTTGKNQPVFHFFDSIGKQYKQPVADDWLYLLPADIVTSITFDTKTISNTDPKKVSDVKVDSTLVPITLYSSIYQHINEETLKLYNVENILSEISSWERRKKSISYNSYVLPRTPEEKRLAEIISEVLGIEQIGVNNSFFELGGNSLLAVQVMLKIQKEFQVRLSIGAVLEEPTISGLAKNIKTIQNLKESLKESSDDNSLDMEEERL